jgi:hypothetical protein
MGRTYALVPCPYHYPLHDHSLVANIVLRDEPEDEEEEEDDDSDDDDEEDDGNDNGDDNGDGYSE